MRDLPQEFPSASAMPHLRDRLKRLHDMERTHGERGALVVLGALWVEAQHSARIYHNEEIPVETYRGRGSL